MRWKLSKTAQYIGFFFPHLSGLLTGLTELTGFIFHLIKISKITDGIKSWSDFHMDKTSKIKSDKDKHYKTHLI